MVNKSGEKSESIEANRITERINEENFLATGKNKAITLQQKKFEVFVFANVLLFSLFFSSLLLLFCDPKGKKYFQFWIEGVIASEKDWEKKKENETAHRLPNNKNQQKYRYSKEKFPSTMLHERNKTEWCKNNNNQREK